MLSDMPDGLDALVEAQHGVLRRSQLSMAGVTRSRLRWQLDRGRWQQLGGSVVVLHSGPLDSEQQRWAAALVGGDDGALSGRTALAHHGLKGWDDEKLHLLVPHGRRVPAVPELSLVVHHTRRDVRADRHPARPLPVVRLEAAAADAVAWTSGHRTACGLLAALVQQRLTTATRLVKVVEARPRLPHRAIVRPALRDIEGGAHALSEIDFGRLCGRFGLPRPRRQVVRVDEHGRRRYLDAELEGVDGRIVCVEVDGALHLLATQYWQDMDRGNEITIAGDRLLRFASVVFRTQPRRVADQLSRALGFGSLSGRQHDH